MRLPEVLSKLRSHVFAVKLVKVEQINLAGLSISGREDKLPTFAIPRQHHREVDLEAWPNRTAAQRYARFREDQNRVSSLVERLNDAESNGCNTHPEGKGPAASVEDEKQAQAREQQGGSRENATPTPSFIPGLVPQASPPPNI